MGINIVTKGIKDIELIKPLWEQLNSVHLEKSVYFKQRFENFTFDKRMKSIIQKADGENIKLDILLDDDSGKYTGYCLSAIDDGYGEIESIYIERDYRKFGLGGKLMESSLDWFESNNIKNIKINVVYANDDALPFYKRYGFNISNYVLKNDNF
ncbi:MULTISPECIES: GNAT family N-acetyltransferase [unclassified Clostridium]|uniref:GNAT family N-acetyltransferase n=1 Tax=unclassified Clostridium TaxID=2614128 RepID=UPI0002985B8A|nr:MULTISPECIES: GNAT family N-acetyltransferase [unclassified Clostridium]EKQ58281.1 MAG: acetyltransferase [Clostridium sp. Maddingley MBC34-26]